MTTTQHTGVHLRWPHLGPAAFGAGVLLGWAVGLAGGPLAAMLGVAAGLVLGDLLDQHNMTARETPSTPRGRPRTAQFSGKYEVLGDVELSAEEQAEAKRQIEQVDSEHTNG